MCYSDVLYGIVSCIACTCNLMIGNGVSFELVYHSLGCGDRVVAVECLDGFIVTHTDYSQFSDDAAQFSKVRLC